MEIVLTGRGGPEKLRIDDTDSPAPGKGEVRVRVLASGVSFAEVQMLGHRYPMQPKYPFVPGYDLVGTVESIGPEVTGVAVGDRVAALTKTGAWRTHVVVAAKNVVPVPAGLDSGLAAAATMNGVTAWDMVHKTARVRPGQTVLVHGASGGVGSLLVQLAVNAGALVLGTASLRKHDAVRELGAEPIDYRQDVAAAVRALAPNGVDAVFDHLGGDSLSQSYGLLADGGILINYGSASTLNENNHWLVPYLRTMRTFGGFVLGKLIGRGRGRRSTFYYVKAGAAFNTALPEVYKLVETGKLTPAIEARLPITQAAEGLRMLMDGKVTGKIVLEASEQA
jgi:synaptic vesicle membrane protein VAT-1